MRRYKITALLLCAAMAVTAAVGCSDGKTDSRSASRVGTTVEAGKNEGVADNEVSAAVSEKANANETVFTLNKVIDGGTRTDKGERYLYLDITIDNATDKAYELNTLNNFYLLFSDGSEAHYDVRTQLYAAKNMSRYSPNPFSVPAKGQFSGVVGGFAVSEDVKDLTVCFFPTLDNEQKKPDVVKVAVTEKDIITISDNK